MTKNITLSQQAAHAAGVTIPLAAQARAMYQMLVNSGNGHKDFLAYRMLTEDRSQRNE
jgi:3-hydroxyisobutyrate dehydrogenase-like beta-hydroxyacid dehydrogenase